VDHATLIDELFKPDLPGVPLGDRFRGEHSETARHMEELTSPEEEIGAEVCAASLATGEVRHEVLAVVGAEGTGDLLASEEGWIADHGVEAAPIGVGATEDLRELECPVEWDAAVSCTASEHAPGSMAKRVELFGSTLGRLVRVKGSVERDGEISKQRVECALLFSASRQASSHHQVGDELDGQERRICLGKEPALLFRIRMLSTGKLSIRCRLSIAVRRAGAQSWAQRGICRPDSGTRWNDSICS
jgi:hypothetical protein